MAKWHADLPDVIDPVDNVCFVVEVPNHPDYIAAFHGTYERLSHWWAWQRDPDKQGRLAAARWRQAVQETWINIERWGNLCALEINVNCGCCDGDGYTYEPNPDYGQLTPEQVDDLINLPDGLEDDGINPPGDYWPTYEDYRNYKCGASIRLADDLLESFNRMGNLGGTLLTMSITGATAFLTTGFTSTIVGALAAFLTPFGAVAAILALIVGTFAVSLRYLYLFGQIRGSMSRDDLICLLYTSANPVEARNAWISEVHATYPFLDWDDADESLFDTFLLNLLDYLTPDELFRSIFGLVAGYDTGTGFDCDQCGPGPEITPCMQVGTYDGAGGFDFAAVPGGWLDDSELRFYFRTECDVLAGDTWTITEWDLSTHSGITLCQITGPGGTLYNSPDAAPTLPLSGVGYVRIIHRSGGSEPTPPSLQLSWTKP